MRICGVEKDTWFWTGRSLRVRPQDAAYVPVAVEYVVADHSPHGHDLEARFSVRTKSCMLHQPRSRWRPSFFQFLQFLLSPFSQALVDFRNFKHLPPGNRINYFIANLTGVFGKILPMSRIVEKFFAHIRDASRS